MRTAMLIASLAVMLAACGGGGGGRYGDYDDDAGDAEAAAEDAEQAAEEARQAVFEEHGADSDGTGADASIVDAYALDDTGNYDCTEDCSGHEAGFAWAQEHDVADAFNCGGNSQSFIEGCEAFVYERQQRADRETQEAGDEAAEAARYEADEEDEDEDSRGRMLDGRL